DDPTVCPAGFVCAQITDTGESGKWQCKPQSGVCCIDGDGDLHGTGGGCLDADCVDTDPDIYNGHPEICDGKDNDCINGVDDFPIDCATPMCELGSLGYYERGGDVCAGAAGCQQQAAVLCDLYTCDGGGEAGDTCATMCDVEADTLCIPSAQCVQDLVDGSACGTDDQRCQSGHCQNGFCCATGDCCAGAGDCPGSYSSPPVCTSPSACDGEADVAACQSNECVTLVGVDDDS